MKTSLNLLAAFVATTAMTFLSGCGGSDEPAADTPTGQQSAEETGEKDHGHPHGGHGAGPHDGTLADWGGGKYHVEFTVDHDKKESIVYVLDGDENSPFPMVLSPIHSRVGSNGLS